MREAKEIEPEVTFLIPCLNEELSIGVVIQEIHKSFKAGGGGLIYEILIADNGSIDSSIAIAQNLGARVINVPTKGYGSALIAGILAANGKYVVMGDADGSYTFGDSEKMLTNLRNGDDLVMGNRFAGGIFPGAMPRLHKYLGNPVLSFLGRLFFKIKIKDFHCGLRGFNRNSILDLNLKSTGMEFASEMVVSSRKRNLKISEVPVTLKPDLRDRAPHLRTWSDGWRHLRFLLAQSPLWAFLIPAILSLLFALLMSLLSFNGPTTTLGVSISYRTSIVASSLATITSVLAWYFVIAKEILNEFSVSTHERIRKVMPLLSSLFIVGVSIILVQYLSWWRSGFGAQPLGKSLLFTIWGGFLAVNGFISIMSYFLIGVIRNSNDLIQRNRN
jgi:glycosyltransferase involved in cell wall biosynthesis